ncbi:META domain-containing protein [Allosphingosinicella flava]|uniref:META domain-containing protein n=1 Tax=Allosphingosinicella flava TaxID=2771430 RepID=A0A7T2GKP6_9SPHN|nr:META domain-containing protein [Sphingosinicella flava]QPQ55640.1 META domain-containing protein [Sphingosinicella flava]
MKIFLAPLGAALTLAACSAYGPNPAPAPPPPSSATYRALGTEPGWTVTIAGERIDYEGDYGETRFTVPRVEPRTTFNGHRYESRTARHSLIVDITHLRCNDGMSGRVFADTVMVEADGKTLRGCGGDILPSADLAETRWSIVSLNGEAMPRNGAYFIHFSGERLSGKAGCNAFSAAYTVANFILNAGPVASTKMACSPPLMQHEQGAIAVLSQPSNLRFRDGNTLILSSPGGSMVLQRAI